MAETAAYRLVHTNFTMTGAALCAFLFAASAPAAYAQELELPAYAYDLVTEISYAMTAEKKCDGITTRPKKLQDYIISLYGQLGDAGISPLDAARHIESEFAKDQIATRAAAFRAKYDAAPDNDADFCRAVRGEATQNDALAALIRIR